MVLSALRSAFSIRALTPSRMRSSGRVAGLLAIALVLPTTSGCQWIPPSDAQAPPGGGERADQPVAVETAVANRGSLETPLEYTGTTQPVQQVALRAQVEGRLLDLTVDVGDRVTQGTVVGQVDDRLLAISLNEAAAEQAALEAEVSEAEAAVSEARAAVEQARAEAQQAQADADRLQSLVEQGVVPEQEAEQAQTAVRTAEQVLQSAQEQVRTRQQTVIAAQRRVDAQRATVAAEQERRNYSVLTAPISSAVVQRLKDPGDLVQPGEEILTLGDFSALKVVVQVSELELAQVRSGQPVSIRLDAYPEQVFQGTVTQISPAADPIARLIPVEITMPNTGGQLGSGLLARVQFQSSQAQRVVIPEAALVEPADDSERPSTPGNSSDNRPPNSTASTEPTSASTPSNQPRSVTVFVVDALPSASESDPVAVKARSIQVGDRADGQVEVRSGLQPGEVIVVRGAQQLQDGQLVRLSALSETAP